METMYLMKVIPSPTINVLGYGSEAISADTTVNSPLYECIVKICLYMGNLNLKTWQFLCSLIRVSTNENDNMTP